DTSAAYRAAGVVPLAGGGSFVPVLVRRPGGRGRGHGDPPDRWSPRGQARPGRAAKSNRGGRDHALDPDPLLRGEGPVARARRRTVGHGRSAAKLRRPLASTHPDFAVRRPWR